MKNQPKIIAIVGGSGAGKTWLARRLQHAFGPQARLSQDAFYYDLGHLPPPARAQINFDHPRTIDWLAFATVLRGCRDGRLRPVPPYTLTPPTRLPGGKRFG